MLLAFPLLFTCFIARFLLVLVCSVITSLLLHMTAYYIHFLGNSDKVYKVIANSLQHAKDKFFGFHNVIASDNIKTKKHVDGIQYVGVI